MQCNRVEDIAADIELAEERLLAFSDGDGFNLEYITWEEDESLTFAVRGVDGDFSAFLPDDYPHGTATVHGPDSFHFTCVGTVESILRGVLGRMERMKQGLAKERCVATSIHSDSRKLEVGMEERLRQDVESYRRAWGDEAVSCIDACAAWRIRLRIDLREKRIDHGPSKFARPLLDESTAGVWGIHPTHPLLVELHVPSRGYLTDGSDVNLTGIWQQSFTEWKVEKQLQQIITDFISRALPRTPWRQGGTLEAAGANIGGFFSQDELRLVQFYQRKKENLLQKADQGRRADFLLELGDYIRARITTLHEYCPICDEPLSRPPMVMRTVCSRPLCMHRFMEFGALVTTAAGAQHQVEVLDLLMCMFIRACLHQRASLILEPYPCVLSADGKQHIFDPQSQDLPRLQQIVQEMVSNPEALVSAVMSPGCGSLTLEARGLVNWVLSSNRSYLSPLPCPNNLGVFGTDFQFLLLSAPPERERRFQELKAEFGSSFAFHGSPAENWHSILRNGLRNASDTKLMTTGARFGPGIYLALDSRLSLQYARCRDPSALSTTPAIKSQAGSAAGLLALAKAVAGFTGVITASDSDSQHQGRAKIESLAGFAPKVADVRLLLGSLEKLTMLSICEVIRHPSITTHASGRIWVAPIEETVITRLFLVYTDLEQHPGWNVRMNAELEDSIRAQMQQFGVGVSALQRSL